MTSSRITPGSNSVISSVRMPATRQGKRLGSGRLTGDAFKHVAQPPHRDDAYVAAGKLLAQTVQYDLDGVEVGFAVLGEHLVEQLGLVYRKPAAGKQGGQGRMFARREKQQVAVERKGAAFTVIGKRTALQAGRLASAAAAHQRGHASLEFFERERLGEEIVGAQVQAAHAILQRPLCREQQ